MTKTANLQVANAAFSFDLLRQVYSTSKDGVVQLSPFSVRRALTMAALGAKGKTLKQFLDVFHLPRGTDLHVACEYNLEVLNQMLRGESGGTAPTEISVANAMWLQDGFPVLSKFKTDNQRYFDAEVRELNFDAAAVKAVNDWVKAKTKDKIDSIVDELHPDDRAILTDALYLKTPAKERFRRAHDRKAKFYKADGSTMDDVTFMEKPYFSSSYFNGDGVEVLRFPFGQKGTFSYYLVLPKKDVKLGDVVSKLTGDQWAAWKSSLVSGEGRFALPPNEQKFGGDLVGALGAMGLVLPLSDDANFSGISPVALKIGGVLHKTFTKFTRKGFEGAAVTAVIMRLATSCVPMPRRVVPFDITVDRPWAWLVEGNGEILFAATTQAPKEPDSFKTEDDKEDSNF